MSKTAQVIEYQLEHPLATGREVAEALGITRNYVAVILAQARKKGKLPPVARGAGRLTEIALASVGQPPPSRMKQEPMFQLSDMQDGDLHEVDTDDDPEYNDAIAKIRALRDRAKQRCERYTQALALLEGKT